MARKQKPRASTKPTAKRNTTKKLARTGDYYSALVRPTEADHRDYNTRYLLGDLVKRYNKYVKVAALRNAQAVAGLKLKVCREVKPGRAKAFRTKRVDAKQMNWFASSSYGSKAVDTAKEYEEIIDQDHPVVSVLTKVNPEMNGYELIESTQLLLGLTGNYFWFMSPGPRGYPTEIWPMYPQFMDIVPRIDGIVEKYIWGRGTECMREFEPRQIVPFRNPNPFGNPWWGVGDLYSCVTEADLSTSFSAAALTMMDRGAQPGLIINAPGMDEGQRRQLEAALARKADGGRNAGRSLVLSLPKDAVFQNWEMGSKEAGVFAGTSEQRARDIIAACFDMPVGLLNMEEKSLANGKVVAPLWQMYGVAPRAQRLQDTINERVLPAFHAALGDRSLFVSFESPIKEDEDAIVSQQVSLYTAGIRTLNEVRKAIGDEPVPDGDRFAPVAGADPEADDTELESDSLEAFGVEVPADVNVQGTAMNGGQITGLSDLAERVASGQLPVESASALAAASFPMIPPEMIAAIFNPLRNFTPEVTPEQQAKIEAAKKPVPSLAPGAGGAAKTAAPPCAGSCEHDHHDSTIKAILAKPDATKAIPEQDEDGPPRPLVVTLASELAAAYMRSTPSIIAGLTTRGFMGSSVIDVVEDSGLPTMLVTDVAEAAKPLFADGWQRAFEGITIPTPQVVGSFDITNEFARESFQGYTVRLARSVTDTTARALTDTIQEGVARGASVPELTESVKQVMDDLSGYAAERIARTEASRAYTAGRITQWKSSGIVEARKWRLSGDPCPMCLAAEQQFKSVPLDEPMVARGGVFKWIDAKGVEKSTTMDFAAVEGGDIHPNCVLGTSRIDPGSIVAAMRANYSGPIVEIRTALGRVLSVTENHPLLTPNGFVAAKLIKHGDDLVGCLAGQWPIDSVDPHDYNVPPTAQEVFDSAMMTIGMATRAVPLSAEYLHGDGRRVNGQIDVVAADSLLGRSHYSTLGHKPCEHCFCVGYTNPELLTSGCDLDSVLTALRLASEGSVGSLGHSRSLLRRANLGQSVHGLRSVAGNETSLLEPTSDNGSGDAESIGDCLDRFSSVVGLDQVISVDVREFSGHVYDFSTVSSAYICDGIIVHNCRCTIEAIFIPEVANA